MSFTLGFALLLLRGFLVSVAGAFDVFGADCVFGTVGVTTGFSAATTGSVAFVFLRTARFSTRFFFVFSSIFYYPFMYKFDLAYFNLLLGSVK